MRPLEGIRVVEVAMMAFVPSAAAVLADWGADVIKVEHPEHGDLMRHSTINGIPPGTWRDGFTMMWENPNRGKRSIGLNLAIGEGRRVLDELVSAADVFITNFLPNTQAKLRLEPDHIFSTNPRIIYARGSGYGPRGELASAGGYDFTCFWNRTGIAYELTQPGQAPPTPMPGPAFGDYTSGMALAGGIAAALLGRHKTGSGTIVDVSLLHAGMWSAQASLVGADLVNADSMPRLNRYEAANPLVGAYRTKDDRFVVLCMLRSDQHWVEFCKAVHPDLLDDDRFDNMDLRRRNSAALVTLLDERFAEQALEYWKDILSGQDGPWDVVQSPGEVMSDPQALDNGYVVDVDYGEGRVARLIPVPVQFDGQAITLQPAPTIGEHTDSILSDLGHDWEQIIDLKVKGAVS